MRAWQELNVAPNNGSGTSFKIRKLRKFKWRSWWAQKFSPSIWIQSFTFFWQLSPPPSWDLATTSSNWIPRTQPEVLLATRPCSKSDPSSKSVYSILSLPTHNVFQAPSGNSSPLASMKLWNKEAFANGKAKIPLTLGKQCTINKTIYFIQYLWQWSIDLVASWCCEFPVGTHSFWASFLLP